MVKDYLDERILEAEKRLEEAKQHRKMSIKDAQFDCGHEQVGECDYESGSAMRNPRESMRVCLKCGLSEEGRFPKVLINKLVYKLTRDQVYSFRRDV